MKNTFLLILVIVALILPNLILAEDRLVADPTDLNRFGELRQVLQGACAEEGDDIIRFVKNETSEIRIRILSPLVIPRTCKGTVTLQGFTDAEVIIDSQSMQNEGDWHRPGESCLLYVYSDGHTIRNITFVDYDAGAGVCLYGNNNVVESSRFGFTQQESDVSNAYGIVISDAFRSEFPEMTGSGNVIRDNAIRNSMLDGVFVEGDATVITGNDITANGRSGIYLSGAHDSVIKANDLIANAGCPDELLPSHDIDCRTGNGNTGAGVVIDNGSSRNMIGGADFDADRNVIQYNRNAGVSVRGNSVGNHITHNIISNNYPRHLIGIDLGDDGPTVNDWDADSSGPNHLLDHAFHLQALPLVKAPNGQERYWTWGFVPSSDRIEMYGVSHEDVDRAVDFGGGHRFYGDFDVIDGGFVVGDINREFGADQWITALSFDADGNTSEFSGNAPVGPDADMDGIPDVLETGGEDGSSPVNADTDRDGLPDALEDKNRNGIWDESKEETSAYLADSDEDGLDDWVETHGDGIYDVAVDTDPLNPDTDGDTLIDGDEDANNNGIWEVYLKETNPLMKDSDGDSFPDATDVCPWLLSGVQDPLMCAQ